MRIDGDTTAWIRFPVAHRVAELPQQLSDQIQFHSLASISGNEI
jgi:hypothetical protein